MRYAAMAHNADCSYVRSHALCKIHLICKEHGPLANTICGPYYELKMHSSVGSDLLILLFDRFTAKAYRCRIRLTYQLFIIIIMYKARAVDCSLLWCICRVYDMLTT